MSYANAIADIAPGSTWTDQADGGLIRIVRWAAARYVSVIGVAGPFRESEFRARFAQPYDRSAIRNQFRMTIANLEHFQAYWIPETQKFVARSFGAARQFALPESAQLIGTYARPFKASSFLSDLDDLIARNQATALASAPRE